MDDARIYNTALSASEIANIVAEAPPAAPVLTAPANSATGVAVNPTLNWNSVTTATSYQAQVSTTSDFASTVFNQSGITATSVQANGLANNTVYYWRVRASNTAGNGDWSTVWSFTTTNGGSTATLTRGPYMNLATQNSIIIRWRTDIATDSKVSFGDAPGNLTASATDPTIATEHIVKVNGLADNTKYYYSIGSSDQKLQGDANNYFKTLPASGSKQKVRILAMGDMGRNSTTQKDVRNAYLNYNGANYTDIWMLLGDDAYENGFDSEFQANFFNIFKDNLTKNHVLWPAPGNHDYANSPARQADHAITYYDIFSLPVNGEAGGAPSGTEAYYSYDYGNIHFVSLDSYGWETNNTRLYDTTGPQAKWLKQDLAANNQKWTVVYFHHPPYTKGTDSDTDPQMINIRQKIVPILERYNVDLVLCGHSHIYERSFLINGHYGSENTFNIQTMALSNSSGQYDGSSNSCLYVKNSSDVRNGIVYAVVGSAGTVGGTSTGYPHNAMEYSNNAKGGAMVIEINDNRLDAKWVCSDGIIRDNFTIMKGVNKTISTTISSGESTSLTASWIGNYIWSNGETTRSITVSPQNNTSYTVGDNFGCLKDSFNITVASNISSSSSANSSISINNNLPLGNGQLKIKAFPNPSLNNFALIIESSSSENVEIVITDIYGRKVYQAKGVVSQTYTLGNGFSSGMYIVKVMQGKNIQTLKLIKRK